MVSQVAPPLLRLGIHHGYLESSPGPHLSWQSPRLERRLEIETVQILVLPHSIFIYTTSPLLQRQNSLADSTLAYNPEVPFLLLRFWCHPQKQRAHPRPHH